MAFDADAIATALALRYAAAAVTPPTGYQNVRSSTANAPAALGALPAVVVFPDEGDFETGNGTRQGGQDWLVSFYYEKAADLPRQLTALRKWRTVLSFQLRTSAQLGGIVDVARLDGWNVGVIAYNGVDHAGIELRVHTVTTEPWLATS